MKVKLQRLTRLELSSKGYMQYPKDWKNVEMTGYLKFINGKSEKKDEPDEFTSYASGGDHETPDKRCEGSAYNEQLSYNGDRQMDWIQVCDVESASIKKWHYIPKNGKLD